MKTGQNGIALIKKFEGCKLTAYLDSVKIPTIGYGNTFYEDNSKVKLGDKITQERAEQLLQLILPRFEKIVNSTVKVPLTQNQFDALVSLSWNTGGSSALFSLINQLLPKEQIATWIRTHYITAGGVKLNGLVRRRNEEAELYLKA